MSAPNDRRPSHPGDVDVLDEEVAGEGTGQNGRPQQEGGSLQQSSPIVGNGQPTAAATNQLQQQRQQRQQQPGRSLSTTATRTTTVATGKRSRDASNRAALAHGSQHVLANHPVSKRVANAATTTDSAKTARASTSAATTGREAFLFCP